MADHSTSTTSATVVDVIVVGGGLIGSAAARYLAEGGYRTAVFVSPEPADLKQPVGPVASHYDQGRITRIADADPFWAEAAQQSIARYQDVERRSGIGFFTQRPLLYVSPEATRIAEVAAGFGADVRMVKPSWMVENTGVHMPPGSSGDICYEAAPAGHINPREMVRAQLTLAAAAGATIINHPATAIEQQGATATVFSDGEAGLAVTGQQVLLATGPYGAELLGLDHSLRRDLRTVAMIVPPADLAAVDDNADPNARLLPNLIMSSLNRPTGNGIYWVPPVRYPDGNVYLKIGLGSDATRFAATTDDVAAWFRSGGDDAEVAELLDIASQILNQPLALGFAQPCVVTHAPDSRPVFDRLTPAVMAAFAGAGAAAKSSDELGRRAAGLLINDDAIGR